MTVSITRHLERLRTQVSNPPVRSVFLGGNADYYGNFPTWQRSEVWTPRKMKLLIYALLHGIEIPAFYLFSRDGQRFMFDGRQRFTALERFVSNRLKLPSAEDIKASNPGFPIDLEPMYFKDLQQTAPELAEEFLNLPLTFITLLEPTEAQIRLQFQCINDGKALVTGEKVRTHYSSATAFIEELAGHRLFREVYKGSDKQGQVFHMCCMVLLMQKYPMPVLMTPERIRIMAAGREEISDEDVQAAFVRLEHCCHLFVGALFYGKTDSIAMIQAIHILTEAGYDLEHSERGCLAPWLKTAKSSQIYFPNRLPGSYNRLFSSEAQMGFWRHQRILLLQTPGLRKPISVGSPAELLAGV